MSHLHNAQKPYAVFQSFTK